VNPPQRAHCGDKHCMGVAPSPRLSIGVSSWSAGGFAELLRRTQEAIYRAKCNGRDRTEIC
jgi:PleD family two-component response regulator